MAQDRESRVTLRWLVQQSDLNQIKSSADVLIKKLGDIQGTAGRSTETMKRLADASKTIARANDITEIANQFARMGKAIKDDTEALKQMRQALKEVGATKGEIAQATTAFQAGGGGQASGGGKNLLSVAGPAMGAIQGAQQGDIAQAGVGIFRLIGSLKDLGPTALATAPAIATLATGLFLIRDAYKKNDEIIRQSLATLDAYYKALAEGTTESINAQLRSLQKQKEIVDKQLANITGAADEAFKSAQKSVTDFGARILFALGQTGLYGTTLQETGQKTADLKKQQQDLQAQMDGLTAATNSSTVAANDAAAAEAKLADERRRSVLEGIDREVEARRLLRTATSDQVKEMITAGNDEIAAIEKRMAALEKEGLVSVANLKLYDELSERVTKLRDKNNELSASILPIIQATEQFKNSLKKLTENIIPPQAKSAWEDLQQRIKQATEAAIARDNALIASQRKYENDVKQIEENGLQKRADIQSKYNDRLVEIAKEAAESAANALRKLEEQRTDLARDLSRDDQRAQREAAAQELDIRIGAAREDEREFRNHLRNLERIRQEAQDREFELILNRDFAGLFFSRRQTTRALQGESQEFAAGRQERQIGAQQQLEDLRRNIANERNERLIAYQYALQDAQIAYIRERQEANRQRIAALAEARATRQRELTDLNQSIRAQLNARRQGYIEELRLAVMVAKERAKLEEALLQRARSMLSLVTKTTPVKRASGGPLGTGQLASVNELGSSGKESFSSGGKNYPFPGPGFFFPTQPGTVNANGGGAGANITAAPVFYITGGANPEATAKAIEPMVYRVLKQVVGVK